MMLFRSDFDRRIDLPGAGPCARPTDVDQGRTGFSDLVSLRVYSFVQGMEIDGEAEDDEVFIVLMRGEADLVISSGSAMTEIPLRHDGGSHVIYMPPSASYRLSAIRDCDIAYARTKPVGGDPRPPRGFAAKGGRLEIIGYATGMDVALATISAGETVDQVEPPSERFVHVRSDDGGSASIGEHRLNDWDTIAVGSGERVLLKGHAGSVDMLMITGLQRHGERSQGSDVGNE
ncbi:5-deoxy-glucuronate isomerase [Sphingomonas sp.]|uniref:5-deoxy-glucuronate isomerase n=1 Tax=Sphingomonas sp. TaxID=28214 RepID=UPI003B0091B8